MQYTKTNFVKNQAPPINEVEMNKIGDALSYLAKMSCEKASFNAGTSTASSYIITIPNYSSPPTSELPLAVIFTPTVTNALGLQITVSWGATKYPVFDVSTNNYVAAGEVKQNQPIQMFFDGSKFWIAAGSRYLQYGITSQQDGYFDRSTSAPLGNMRLNYNGDFYTVRLFGAVYNNQGADIAEGYPIKEEPQFGDLICIEEDGSYAINKIPLNTRIIGFVSDERQFAAFYGADYGNTPVAIAGRVAVRVDGPCMPGQFFVAGNKPGTVIAAKENDIPRFSVVAMALEAKENDEIGLVLAKLERM